MSSRSKQRALGPTRARRSTKCTKRPHTQTLAHAPTASASAHAPYRHLARDAGAPSDASRTRRRTAPPTRRARPHARSTSSRRAVVTGGDVAAGLERVLRATENEQTTLDALDAVAGDGDHGITMVLG